MSGRKPPRLLSGGLTGRTYIVTAYTEHEDGRITANTKHDVTADLDAIVAERVAALAEDEAALNAVWDAMETHGHNGIECRPEKPMDYTAVYVIHALAAVLAERRPSDG